ncbi:Pepsin A [Babesia microti strain RI]|uniref:Pepsin A n=1 Tax=Babesia microti (strain RI) TaxID=1133968 RepID=A0A1N6LXZ3_BABMR|nr:Pepsin A [Babesia microti strain RI]SIO73738.1 Pepsin A [Babesia microti strain RI]|eukprot:XP_021337801.1 Pepsin A [Babesia microti strain RI]
MLYNEILICCTIICITLNAAFSLKHHQFTDVKNCDVCKGNECRLCVYSPNSPKAEEGDLSIFLDENHKNVKKGSYYSAIRGKGIGGSLGSLYSNNSYEMITINHIRNSQYTGEVEIGNPRQKIYPIFDTGSTNLWTVGSDCSSEYCQNVHVFDPEASKTFSKMKNTNDIYIKFGTGEVEGYAGKDTVKIGNLIAHNQSFGIIVKESAESPINNPFKAIQFEGIVGLGFPDMSSIPGTPIFDNLAHQNLISTEFSFYFSKDSYKNSYLFIGGIDEQYYKGPVHMFPVAREHYWEVKLDALYIDDIKFCCDEPSYIIFDSGTSFNTLPSHEIKKFFKRFPEVNCEDIDNWPVITYVIHGIRIKLTPHQYVLKTGVKCRPAYMQLDVPSEFGHAYILGTYSFMRHYVTIYKRSMQHGQPSLVGVAKANHNEEF